MESVLSNSMWIVGSGEQINMWTNNWLGDSLLSLLDLPASLAPSLPEKVSSIITNGQYDLPQVLLFFPLVTDRIIKTIIPISPLQDHLIWLHSSDGDLSSKHAHAFLHPSAGVLSSLALIWRVSIPPSHSIFWRLMYNSPIFARFIF